MLYNIRLACILANVLFLAACTGNSSDDSATSTRIEGQEKIHRSMPGKTCKQPKEAMWY